MGDQYMNRRQLIAVMAALSGGGAVATGTGAFSSVTADRSVSVSVADDSSAYLKIAPSNDDLSAYVNSDSDGQFDIDLTGNGQGDGLNVGATTVFENLFEIRNQGTQPVEVNVSPLAFSKTGDDGGNALTLQVPSSFPTFTLDQGEKEKITVIAAVDSGFAFDADSADIDREIEITAKATSA